MGEFLSVRESARLLTYTAQDVCVNIDGCKALAKRIVEFVVEGKDDVFGTNTWCLSPQHPNKVDSDTLNWIFVVDSLNFSFWDEKPLYAVNFEGKTWTGYYSLCATINRAISDGVPITNAEYLANVSLEEVRDIFRSDSSKEVPLLERRKEVMNEVGKVLLDKFNGSVVELISSAKGSAVALMNTLLTDFPCFADRYVLNGNSLTFAKRAQIFVADLWAAYNGEGYGKFSDIGEITMFADYRVPQALLGTKCITYSESLLQKLHASEPLAPGSRLECEIRGCSIHSVEVVVGFAREEAVASGCLSYDSVDTKINAILVDFYLWDDAKKNPDNYKKWPVHKTRSVFY